MSGVFSTVVSQDGGLLSTTVDPLLVGSGLYKTNVGSGRDSWSESLSGLASEAVSSEWLLR